jgi:uncharacterized protein YdeI (BOF family)
MFKSLSIAAIALLSTAAIAQHVEKMVINKDGEILIIESRDNNTAFPAVVAAIEKAGYARRQTVDMAPGTKMDTWCKVDVYLARQIIGECYTPRMGHGVSVRDHLEWSQHSFKGDYSGVPTMIAKIRDEHRRASTTLGIK